jgi:hypothetical protein
MFSFTYGAERQLLYLHCGFTVVMAVFVIRIMKLEPKCTKVMSN